MNFRRFSLSILFLWVGLFFLPAAISAQEVETWTTPFQLSGQNTKSGEASLSVDQSGYVHAVWSEELENNRSIIQYARFDGQTWTKPTDFHVTPEMIPVNEITSYIDSHNTLHVIWSQGFDQVLFYSHTPADKAYSSINWSRPFRLTIQAATFRLIVDENDTFHLLYAAFGQNQGLFYIHSTDRGISWTSPLWFDPDLPAGTAPTSLSFEMDHTGGLHAVWAYKDFDENKGDWVRYIRSPDRGITWTSPRTIAKNSEGDAALNAFVRPNMIVNGDEVHIVWAGGGLLYRLHRYSLDLGQTWSATKEDIFGGLNGQAGDGLARDALGRVHFFGQIRFPQGIYHAIWQNGQWSPPTLVYLMRITSTEEYGEGVVLAHRTFPVVRAGNQLVLTFTDEPANPNRRLFVLTRYLTDAPALTPVPFVPGTPTTTETPPLPVETTPALPTSTPTNAVTTGNPNGNTGTGASPASFSNRSLLIGIAPALGLIAVVLFARFLYVRRQA